MFINFRNEVQVALYENELKRELRDMSKIVNNAYDEAYRR